MRVVHFTGSPVGDDWADLSRLYARGALAALRDVTDHEHVVVDVSPDGTWRFVESLEPDVLASSDSVERHDAIARISRMGADVGVPQMFCPPGLTEHRALISLLGIASVGNSATTMAITADKQRTRAIVAAAGVAVPDAVVVRRGDPLPAIEAPVVVKPVAADNSAGLRFVDDTADLAEAVEHALAHDEAVLVEDFVPLGREVRCGTIRSDAGIRALPLEEYAVDPVDHPVRLAEDKLARDDDGVLTLMAKSIDRAWIVDDDDPATTAVHDLAVLAHRALGCDHHGLVDVRVDPDGRPWFLEAGPYCSFAPSSVVVTMAEAAGIGLGELFEGAVDDAVARAHAGSRRG